MSEFAGHSGFARVFPSNRLTIGFVMSLDTYSGRAMPTLADRLAHARWADEAGFAALWLRDMPILDPGLGDADQVLDPFVLAGFLAGVTSRIGIGTAGVILPLRDPKIVARQATSVDQLLDGRFLLGLSSGDHPAEFPAFGLDFADRAKHFRHALDDIKVVTTKSFRRGRSRRFGALNGAIDLMPNSAARPPFIAVGHAGQDYDWLAANMDAWIWHGPDISRLSSILPYWRALNPSGPFRPYGYSVMIDLLADVDAPLQSGRCLRAGRHALIELLRQHQDEGVSHVMLDMKLTLRPVEEVIEELAEHVLPLFPAL